MSVNENADATGEVPTELRRSLGLWQMVAYAAGSMLGAGIYGLVGVAADEMGSAVWLAFLVALVVALLTGLSYASLGSRYPRAGGAAYVTHRAYRHGFLTHMVGLAIASAGITSMAAGARVIGANLQILPMLGSLPVTILSILFVVLMASIVYRGIRESMWVNIVSTIIEAGGLFLVIAVGARYWGSVDLFETPAAPTGGGLSAVPMLLMMQGAVLTFYSFLGFEDALNVGEELKNPRRNLPLGIIMAMALAAILYIGVAITAVSVVPWRELADAAAPLAEVMARAAPWFPNWAFIAITIIAVGNTGLINYITASRLLYGMARDGQLPPRLGLIHPVRRTPHIAVYLIFALIVALILLGDISQLAAATVLLMLLVFAVVNTALVVLKLKPGEPKGSFEVPMIVPVLGVVVCLALFFVRLSSGDWVPPVIGAVLLLSVAVLYFVVRPQGFGEAPPNV